MTIVCFKNGFMAADSQTTRDGSQLIVSRAARKLVRTGRGALYGCAGDAAVIARFAAWAALFEGCVKGGANLRRLPHPFVAGDEADAFAALWATPEGTLLHVYQDGEVYAGGEEAMGAAIGVARDIAIGAMLHGASAHEAALICARNCAGCGGEVRVERIGSAPLPLGAQVHVGSFGEAPRDDVFADDPTGALAHDLAWQEANGLRGGDG